MENSFHIVAIDTGDQQKLAAVARCDNDLVLETLTFTSVNDLENFRKRLEGAITGKEVRPNNQELIEFGHKLFSFIIRDGVEKMYTRLSNERFRICIISNNPLIQSLPWEYMQDPSQLKRPRINRVIVRVVPTIGVAPRPPLNIGHNKLMVLFVSADPLNQAPVDSLEVKSKIESTFAFEDQQYNLDVIPRASRNSLRKAIQAKDFDVLHFSGHGRINQEGEGELVLVDKRTNGSSYLKASELGRWLSGRERLRLVVLSACETAVGDFSKEFSVISKTLVNAGVPAVVANQFPLPNETVAPFVEAMYSELLQSGDIDYAVEEGRITLEAEFSSNSNPDYAPIEWGIPVLYRHAKSAKIFEK